MFPIISSFSVSGNPWLFSYLLTACLEVFSCPAKSSWDMPFSFLSLSSFSLHVMMVPSLCFEWLQRSKDRRIRPSSRQCNLSTWGCISKKGLSNLLVSTFYVLFYHSENLIKKQITRPYYTERSGLLMLMVPQLCQQLINLRLYLIKAVGGREAGHHVALLVN